MADKKITEATNVEPRGTDKIPIARASSVVAYNVTVADIRSGVIDVHDYGAVGDGTTDDSAAINLALAATNAAGSYGQTRAGCIVVKLRPGLVYKITKPLNACEKQGVVLDGGAPGFGATLYGCTDGDAMIEVIGSSSITLSNINFYGDQTLAPSCAVFTSRSDTAHGVNSHNITYDHLQFGGYFTQSVAYIVESESNYFNMCDFYPYGGGMVAVAVLSCKNVLSLTPTNATLGGHDYGLWNINFDRCQITNGGGMRALYLWDAKGSVYVRDSYLYSTTEATIEIRGGAYLHCDSVGCEGTPDETILLTYDAAAFNNTIVMSISSFGFGSPNNYTMYADDNVILQNAKIATSPPGVSGGAAMPVRLWGANNCDFTGLADYRNGVFDILFDSATGYASLCKFRLGLDDTLTISGAADFGNTVENTSALLDSRLQVPALTLGSGSSIMALKTDTVAWNVGSLDNGQSAVTFITITGVESTNWVAFAALTSLDASGWSLVAYPVAGVVYVTLTNHTGGTLNPPDGTLRVVAMKIA